MRSYFYLLIYLLAFVASFILAKRLRKRRRLRMQTDLVVALLREKNNYGALCKLTRKMTLFRRCSDG